MAMNTNRIIELSLVFFIALFSFSIGTFVGKKYSDNQHRLAQLEPNKKQEHGTEASSEHGAKAEHGEAAEHGKSAQTEHGESKTESSGEITDADVAKLAEEFSSTAEEKETAHEAPSHEAKPHETSSHEKKSHEAKSHEVSSTHEPKTKTIKEISVREAELEREVASLPPTAHTAAQAYTVQVGAYPSALEAEKMTEALVAKGYKANSVTAQVNGKTYYRVHVGLFSTMNEAQEYKKELIEKNRLSSAFVQKLK